MHASTRSLRRWTLVAAGWLAAAVPALADLTVTHAGSIWVKKKYDITGAYRIVQDDEGRRFFELDESFKTKDAPDLKVVLSPWTIEQATHKNALEGGAVIGILASTRGMQRLPIPREVELKRYRSVLIHCEEYTILWGGAPLTEGRLVFSGDSWEKKANRIRGQFEIIQSPERVTVRLDSKFETKSAPDLKLVLSPLSVAEASDSNALRGARIVAALSRHEGFQEYVIDGTVDLSAYRSLLIHCQQYSKLWGGAALVGESRRWPAS